VSGVCGDSNPAHVYVVRVDLWRSAGLSDDGTSCAREAYGDHIYRRLAEVKAKYDPDNAFHHNKNICPG
jgi:FAD/FMN-containing dehydrogenase